MPDAHRRSVDIAAKLSPAESALLISGCVLAGISASDWVRHVVFGEPIKPEAPERDKAVADDLRRIEGLILMLRDRAGRCLPDPDQPLHTLADLASCVVDAEAAISKPYLLASEPGPPSVPDAQRTTPVRVRVTEGERALVERAAEQTGLSVGRWMAQVLLAAGRPLPITPHTAEGADAATDTVVKLLTVLVSRADPQQMAAGITTTCEHARDAIRKACRLDKAAVSEPICEAVKL